MQEYRGELDLGAKEIAYFTFKEHRLNIGKYPIRFKLSVVLTQLCI